MRILLLFLCLLVYPSAEQLPGISGHSLPYNYFQSSPQELFINPIPPPALVPLGPYQSPINPFLGQLSPYQGLPLFHPRPNYQISSQQVPPNLYVIPHKNPQVKNPFISNHYTNSQSNTTQESPLPQQQYDPNYKIPSKYPNSLSLHEQSSHNKHPQLDYPTNNKNPCINSDSDQCKTFEEKKENKNGDENHKYKYHGTKPSSHNISLYQQNKDEQVSEMKNKQLSSEENYSKTGKEELNRQKQKENNEPENPKHNNKEVLHDNTFGNVKNYMKDNSENEEYNIKHQHKPTPHNRNKNPKVDKITGAKIQRE